MKQKILDYLKQIKLKNINWKQTDPPKIDLKKADPKKVAAVLVPLMLFFALLWFFVHFSIRETIVLGNIHYTKEEITQTVQKGLFGNNSLIVSRAKKSFTPEGMDLVDRIDVEMKDPHTLQITVQERQLIGYVQYLDCNLYFDSEGRVMNSVVREEESEGEEEEQQALTAEAVGKSATSYIAAMEEAPLIEGLSFERAQLQEVLPVEDTSVFNTILGISRMINKYSIAPDVVVFDENQEITLEYGDVTVNLGADKLMEEKLARVAAILPDIMGKTGVLHMEDYDGSSENIVFSQGPLSAESLDDEEASKKETISHDYALVIRDGGSSQQQGAVGQQAGATQQGAVGDQTGTTGQPAGTTQTGTTGDQTGAAGQPAGTTQPGTTGDQTGTAGQPAGTTQPGADGDQTGTTGQPAGTTQPGTAGDQTGTTQTGTPDPQTGAAQQGTTGGQTGASPAGDTSSSQSSQQVQISKPVLNNIR